MSCRVPIPQTTMVTGRPYGTPPNCIRCLMPVDTRDDYWVLLDGPPQTRCALLAAAHPARWDDELGDYDYRCVDTLRRDWQTAVAGADAHILCLGEDSGGPRFYAGHDALNAGTPIQVLALDGTWLVGRFECDTRTDPWRPLLYLNLGGFDAPAAKLVLPNDAVIRTVDD